MAELAYTGRSENGEWGLALSSAAQGSLIDIVGASFSFIQGSRSHDFLSVTHVTGLGNTQVDDHHLDSDNSNRKIQGVRVVGNDSIVGDPVPAGHFAL